MQSDKKWKTERDVFRRRRKTEKERYSEKESGEKEKEAFTEGERKMYSVERETIV